MRVINLASGSKGNSTLVEYGDTKLLIDVGLTEKKLVLSLAEVGEDIKNISAVIITHEHVDHIRALPYLAKKYDIDFYIETALAESEQVKAINFKEGKLHKILLDKFEIGEVEVLPFKISHDAISPVGYVINAKGSKAKLGLATDLGEVTQDVVDALKMSKLVLIESNYDEEMLFAGNYPYNVKKRIAGAKGHLSNSQSLELAKQLFESGTKCFVLSHISENNNNLELAYSNYACYFESLGLSLDKDVFIRLSYQGRHGNNFILKEDFDENWTWYSK